MSKVKIEGNASGTGTLTISAPNTNTDRTITLPDGAGEILTDASSLSATNLTSGTIPDARFPSTLPAIDGSALTGIGGGKILQITQSLFTGNTSTATTYTYTATGHTGTITTTADNSKILVFIDASGYQSTGGGGNLGLQRKIGTGSYTRLLGVDGTSGNGWMSWGNGTTNTSWNVNKMYLDDPQQSSGTTYTYESLIGNWSNGTQYYGYSGFSPRNYMIMIEVAV